MGSAENKCLGGLRQFVNGRFISVKLIGRPTRIKKNLHRKPALASLAENKFTFNFLLLPGAQKAAIFIFLLEKHKRWRMEIIPERWPSRFINEKR